jgi:hypothetical protein
MKRDPALAGLSRDHHQALAVALRLRRADGDTAGEARAAFLHFWEREGHGHFRIEEDLLLPAFAGFGDAHDPLVARALCEHAVIRHHAAVVTADERPPLALLHELGTMMTEHVRLEERRLFPLIEETIPQPELAQLAVALEEAERAR